MPVFYQLEIDAFTKLGIWKIEEEEDFFKQYVPILRTVSHPHKKLQHLAGRFLLKYLFADFPSHLIQIADTRKPFLPQEEFHFSISHCGDYAAAIVSSQHRVGIDIEIPTDKVMRVQHKFVSEQEHRSICPQSLKDFTMIWSAKESVFKWYGDGNVDFKNHIQLDLVKEHSNEFACFFSKDETTLRIHLKYFPGLCLSYVVS
ncbi:MAG TPA: 4'-phosphopantetheinyl transferase superfamily protein [Niabella sp.]|nr:4'-phosphopantetheinyl transferase superfamily protein [Niabella sp.]HOZ97666.1 4'-phosphopantetheinyl transferase superfamily protein [Niabella sp.]HQW13972.1 4'-phosphopantetheinyl transferase superfamily protein [Niabella sp.]HQX19485.1 4'-phosphopantetheinyl transferase superfamily protein [Niabella sp.]HQX41445.1 4'-phosphopantetheinyl transferase superfamily protein [Niabella sp.]